MIIMLIKPGMIRLNRKSEWVGIRCCVTLIAFFSTAGIAPASITDAADRASVQQIHKYPREMLAALKTYTANQRNEAPEKIYSAQANPDRPIEVLASDIAQNWNGINQAARENSRASLQALRKLRTLVAENYCGLKSGSTSAWGPGKQGCPGTYRALHACDRSGNESDAEQRES